MDNKDKGNADNYAEQLATQLRKGMLSYCVLLVCEESVYTSDIIRNLRDADLSVVEGTIYPLLARLQKDGLLQHEWQESEQGPPRKYYKITEFGHEVREKLSAYIMSLNKTITLLEANQRKSKIIIMKEAAAK